MLTYADVCRYAGAEVDTSDANRMQNIARTLLHPPPPCSEREPSPPSAPPCSPTPLFLPLPLTWARVEEEGGSRAGEGRRGGGQGGRGGGVRVVVEGNRVVSGGGVGGAVVRVGFEAVCARTVVLKVLAYDDVC
jgi:hypothetical protein